MHPALQLIIHDWRFLVWSGGMLGMIGYFACGLGVILGKRLHILFPAAVTAMFSGVFGYFIFDSEGIIVATIVGLFWAACIWVTVPFQTRSASKRAVTEVAHANAMVAWARAGIERFKQVGTDSMTDASIKIALQDAALADADREKASFLLDKDTLRDVGHKVGEYRVFDVSVGARSYANPRTEEVYGASVADLEAYAARTLSSNQAWLPRA